jgi:hypothetical protein
MWLIEVGINHYLMSSLKYIYIFLDMSTQEGDERFELMTSASLSVVPADRAISWGLVEVYFIAG